MYLSVRVWCQIWVDICMWHVHTTTFMSTSILLFACHSHAIHAISVDVKTNYSYIRVPRAFTLYPGCIQNCLVVPFLLLVSYKISICDYMQIKWQWNITTKSYTDSPNVYLSNDIHSMQFGWYANAVDVLHCSFFLWGIGHISIKSLPNCDIFAQVSSYRWILTFFSSPTGSLLMRCTKVESWPSTMFYFFLFLQTALNYVWTLHSSPKYIHIHPTKVGLEVMKDSLEWLPMSDERALELYIVTLRHIWLHFSYYVRRFLTTHCPNFVRCSWMYVR